MSMYALHNTHINLNNILSLIRSSLHVKNNRIENSGFSFLGNVTQRKQLCSSEGIYAAVSTADICQQ